MKVRCGRRKRKLPGEQVPVQQAREQRAAVATNPSKSITHHAKVRVHHIARRVLLRTHRLQAGREAGGQGGSG